MTFAKETNPHMVCRSLDNAGSAASGWPGVTRVLVTVTALAAFAAGCADAAAERPFTPGGALAGAPTEPAPSDSAPAPPPSPTSVGTATAEPSPSFEPIPAERGTQTVSVGDDLTVKVEWPAPDDPDHAAMLAAYRDAYIGWMRAVVTRGRQLDYKYVMDPMLALDLHAWVGEWLEDKESLRGTSRLYNMHVKYVQGQGAEIGVCVDESGLDVIDADTGRALPKQPAHYRYPRAVYYHTGGMFRRDDGTWGMRILFITRQPGERAKGCLQ